jgi:hypothetical protein
MKRASLKTAKVPVSSSASQDVTDRLLSSDPEPTPRTTVSQPKTKRRAQPSESSLADPSAHSDSPSSPDSPTPPRSLALAPIPHALAQTRLALEALHAARTDSPAQYDLGIRVRLDSLAHHLEQVAQFIVRQ